MELAGRVVRPDQQAKGIGKLMLRAYIALEQPRYIATYTRNPAILHMLASVCSAANVFPLEHDDELLEIACQMPHASRLKDGGSALYHFKRYGKGLYQPEVDPAYGSSRDTGLTLAQTYAPLSDPGTALVVTAKAPNKVN